MAVSFDGLISAGSFEYRGATERDGYLLGLNTNIFFFSDFALSLRGNIMNLDAGVYKGEKYANDARILNYSAGILYVVDVMTLLPFKRADAEFYSGNFINDEKLDYGYSMGAGIRYERAPFIIMLELSYKQLYKTTNQWPSIILFTIGTGILSNREKDKELDI